MLSFTRSAVAVTVVSSVAFSQPKAPSNDPTALVQVAVLLDASNSMDGLISQAKSQLWKIVNEFASSKKNGVAPSLEVAFYEYGKSSLDSREGYIRQLTGLTSDLDKVSEQLFALTTNGGDEYCGQVIRRAVDELAWSKNPTVYKAIFIAGNEPFTQGSVDFRESCKAAITHSIVVNTIFCGSQGEGAISGWKDGADLADGNYFAIDQNQQVAYVTAPQDKEILRLNDELNKTYIAYGTAGRQAKKRQLAQDQAAASVASEVAVQRAAAKSSVQYKSEEWDLVEARSKGALAMAAMPVASLPPEMAGMDIKEREAYVDAKAKDRARIQSQIQKLQDDRRSYVEAGQKKQSKGATLDAAMVKAIRTQSGKKGYSFAN